MIETIQTRYWSIASCGYDEVLELMDQWRQGDGRHYVCFCDANGLSHGWSDESLRKVYRKADAVFPDGISLKWLAKISADKAPNHIMGPVLFDKAMEYGVSKGWRHFFYGASPKTVAKLKSRMEAKYPGVKIVGAFSPPYGKVSAEEWSKHKAMIGEARPDFLWVALGCPKQEKWAYEHFQEVDAAVTLPVGAAFDFHAGTAKHSPMWIQRSGLNGIWRLVTGGRRIFRRNAWCMPRAFLILVTELFRIRILYRGVNGDTCN